MQNTASKTPEENHSSGTNLFVEVGLALLFILIIVFSANVLL
jgi:hypothetical protein